jgi:hypothetical protein
MAKGDQFEEAKRTMGALVRMPPKQHDEMKLGKPKKTRTRAPKPSKRVGERVK